MNKRARYSCSPNTTQATFRYIDNPHKTLGFYKKMMVFWNARGDKSNLKASYDLYKKYGGKLRLSQIVSVRKRASKLCPACRVRKAY